MSWAQELYQVYENNYGKDDSLQPIFHAKKPVHIEVTLSEEGIFQSARLIEDKEDSVTIIPITKTSEGRTSSTSSPHAITDSLFYMAGDYKNYVSKKKADGKENKKVDNKYHDDYKNNLNKWAESENSHPSVRAISAYINKGCLVKDLIESSILHLDEATQLIKEDEKILKTFPEDIRIRFRINYRDLSLESRTWKDKSLYESHIKNILSENGKNELCYATGIIDDSTYNHPKSILQSCSNGKLISSNDDNNFVYRGRFNNKEEAFSVGIVFSQKMHIALKWLIQKQGVSVDSMSVIIWQSNMKTLPGILDAEDLDFDEDELIEDIDTEESASETMSIFKKGLKDAIWGSKNNDDVSSILNENGKAVIMILDAPAVTGGRISISLYDELALSDYLSNLKNWHLTTALTRYSYKQNKSVLRSVSIYEIADCAYGTEQETKIVCDPKFKKDIILRLIPCVTEGKSIPTDIVKNLVNKAGRPSSYQKTYNWNKVLEVTCGVLKRNKILKNKQEDYQMAIDKQCKNRDYLFGRLLAVAEVAEKSTYEKDDKRTTNAHRYFEEFSNHPHKTWGWIHKRLVPYLNKMERWQREYYEGMIEEVTNLFDPADYSNDKKLGSDYLLGYYCQINEIYQKKETKNKDNE